MEREADLAAASGEAQPNAVSDGSLDQETSVWGSKGRITRKEFWKRILFAISVPVVLSMLVALIPTGGGFSGYSRIPSEGVTPADILRMLVGGAFLFFLLWFTLVSQVKRWHDVGLSGWMVLLSFVPYIGFINFICAGCIAGTKGNNRYGSDPALEIQMQPAAVVPSEGHGPEGSDSRP